MTTKEVLTLTDVIHRSLVSNPNDVDPLIKYLGMDRKELSFEREKLRATAISIAKYLREMGSNDFATFFRQDGVEYDEVVYDVAQKLGAEEAGQDKTVEENESIILRKLFADALDKMDIEERRQLFSSMGIKESDVPLGAAGTILVQILLRSFGGFATYRMSVVMANMIARALLGSGLSFATNAALTRVIGTFLGPIGWIATGAWLLVGLAGPAYRKTVPAVVHIAMLRQMVVKRVNVGVVGDGSSGKDSLIKAVFGVDTGNIHPVAGFTRGAMIYELGNTGVVHLVNCPGFNDVCKEVNKQVQDMLHYTDVFIMVTDLARGVSQTEVEILRKLESFDRPILICLNKCDLPRARDKDALLKAAHDRLQGADMIETAFDPVPRLGAPSPVNCGLVHEWILRKLQEMGKETSHIPKSEYV